MRPDEAATAESEVAPALPADGFLSRTFAGRYRVTGFIGRGGMGSVYEAEDTALSRTVAVKVVAPRTGAPDQEMHSRFFREAKACAALSHPNIVTVHDFGVEDDGVYFLVMERLRGKPLHQLLQQNRPLEAGVALRMAMEIARGVGDAHAAGLVHRDLKPSNIFVVRPEGSDWSLKVLDFGVVKVLADEGGDLTKTGTLVGSPKYMSPEQVIGVHVEARSDIYSLGALLYRLVVGAAPFNAGTDFQLMEAHVRTEPVLPRARGADISKALNRLIGRCLEKDRHDRFASLSAFLSAAENCPESARRDAGQRAIYSRPPLAVSQESPPDSDAPVETQFTRVEPLSPAATSRRTGRLSPWLTTVAAAGLLGALAWFAIGLGSVSPLPPKLQTTASVGAPSKTVSPDVDTISEAAQRVGPQQAHTSPVPTAVPQAHRSTAIAATAMIAPGPETEAEPQESEAEVTTPSPETEAESPWPEPGGDLRNPWMAP